MRIFPLLLLGWLVGPADAKTEKTCPAVFPGIAATAPDAWRVDRGLVHRYASDLDAIRELARVRVHRGPDGRRDGVRVYGVKCGNPLYAGGLRHGDVVREVNGRPVHSVWHAVGTWMAVRDEARVDVQVQRGGDVRTLRYELVDRR